MAIQIKKPKLNIGRKPKADEAETSAADFTHAETSAVDFVTLGDGRSDTVGDADAFGVNVRNDAAGVKLLDEKAESSWWIRELPHEIATGLALMSILSFLLAAADFAFYIPFALVGVAAYVGFVILGEKTESRIKMFAILGTVAVLAVLAIILRSYIGGGIGYIMNSVYDASEAEQAYIYDRFGTGAAEESTGACLAAATIWTSILFGALGALPSDSRRRIIGLGVAGAAMIAFAYYGLIPEAIVVLLVIAAILFVLARGGLLAALPVLLASLLIFGLIMLIDPGESMGISRMDENFRDRFALRSAYLESDYDTGIPSDYDDPYNRDEYDDDAGRFTNEHKWLVPLIITLIVLGAIGAVGWFLYKRFKARRDANRAGINSEDDKTAIVSMFPYAVRWLGAADIDVSGKSFASLVGPLSQDVSEQYSNYYKSMYVLWREAAYSDHEMESEKRTAMSTFLSDTTEMVQKDMNFFQKLKATLKYAL